MGSFRGLIFSSCQIGRLGSKTGGERSQARAWGKLVGSAAGMSEELNPEE